MNKINSLIVAILTTLAETNGSPSSMIYLALGMDLNLWNLIAGIMVKGGLVTITNHFVTLTPKGREMANQIEAKLASLKK